jgi:hypothetical protein
MPPTCTHKQQNKKKKKRKKREGSLSTENWQWSPLTPKSKKTKGKINKKGGWVPLLLRVDDGAHLHPQATKHIKKKKKEEGAVKTWQWCPPAPRSSKTKRKKRGVDLCQKLAMAPTKTQKKKKKRK